MVPKAGFPGSYDAAQCSLAAELLRGGRSYAWPELLPTASPPSGNAWAAAAESWASNRRTHPAAKGYSTPRYDQDPSTPKYGGGGGARRSRPGGGSRSMPPQGGRPASGSNIRPGGRTPTWRRRTNADTARVGVSRDVRLARHRGQFGFYAIV